jgi:hypothetical protein
MSVRQAIRRRGCAVIRGTFARQCDEAFLAGRSPADFAAEDYEVDFTGRATVDDLDATGRGQLAIS